MGGGHKVRKTEEKWYMPIVDGLRSRVYTIVITAIITGITTTFAVVLSFSPQLLTVTNKVAAIESNYVTKSDFQHYQEIGDVRWTTLFGALKIVPPVSP